MMDIRIEGGRVLVGDRFEDATVCTDDGLIDAVGEASRAAATIDARGLMVLPGVVDIHGDAFERQLMPRPGVHFAMDIALFDTDRQVMKAPFHLAAGRTEAELIGEFEEF